MFGYFLIAATLTVPRIPEPKKPLPVDIAQILVVENKA